MSVPDGRRRPRVAPNSVNKVSQIIRTFTVQLTTGRSLREREAGLSETASLLQSADALGSRVGTMTGAGDGVPTVVSCRVEPFTLVYPQGSVVVVAMGLCVRPGSAVGDGRQRCRRVCLLDVEVSLAALTVDGLRALRE